MTTELVGDGDGFKALDEAIQKRRARLEAVLKGSQAPRVRNFRYVTDFQFGQDSAPRTTQPDLSPYTQAVKSFVVKKGTLFDVVALEMAYTAVGTLAATGEAAQLTLPPRLAQNLFDFYFGIYDSGSDRSWQNQLLPSWVLLSENQNGFWFGGEGEGRGLLSGGSEVSVTVAPWGAVAAGALQALTGLSNLSSHNLQISLVGVEVSL